MTISLSQFCKDHSLPKSSVYNRCKDLGIDTSNGLDDAAQATLIREFKVKLPTPQVTVETGNHQIVLATPELPQTYTLEGLRVSEAIAFDDPLAIAEQFLQTADLLTSAMQNDIDQREHRLKQTKQAQSKIAAKANELKLEQRLYRERASMLDSALSEESQTLQTALSQLQSLGKSIES
jgi:hypothetical protein